MRAVFVGSQVSIVIFLKLVRSQETSILLAPKLSPLLEAQSELTCPVSSLTLVINDLALHTAAVFEAIIAED